MTSVNPPRWFSSVLVISETDAESPSDLSVVIERISSKVELLVYEELESRLLRESAVVRPSIVR